MMSVSAFGLGLHRARQRVAAKGTEPHFFLTIRALSSSLRCSRMRSSSTMIRVPFFSITSRSRGEVERDDRDAFSR